MSRRYILLAPKNSCISSSLVLIHYFLICINVNVLLVLSNGAFHISRHYTKDVIATFMLQKPAEKWDKPASDYATVLASMAAWLDLDFKTSG